MNESSQSVPTPPPLPPRKSGATTPEPTLVPATAASTSPPPPLPPRSLPAPIIVSTPQNGVHGQGPLAEPITVELTPATPPTNVSPVDVVRPSFGQSSEEVKTAPLPDITGTSMQANHLEPVPVTAPPPTLPPRKRKPERKSSLDSITSLSSPISTEALILGVALVLNLALGRLPISWLVILVGAYGVYRVKSGEKRREEGEETVGSHSFATSKDTVGWVNHALYALFPLISADVLTPFIDLLEDALIQQVPPIVTSVRLTSASLGSQPLLLRSLRPMSDEEWFAALTPSHKSQKPAQSPAKSQPSATPPSARTKGHRKSVSSGSRANLTRSVSASSTGSGFNSEGAAEEAQKRRRRDRVLQKISRRHKLHAGAEDNDFGTSPGHGGPPSDLGHLDEGQADEADPDGGQYVNYQVSFEYHRSASTSKRGLGLHVLAYFGWGVKGVGGSEIPVYIDVVSIKGTINLRLLLSATPPFARTATVSFPKLPEFDISAKPLKKGSFNAMELPGMKSYVQASIAEVAGAFVRPASYSLDIDRLLLGRESALRTATVGIIHLIIHSAEGLPKTDAMGSCDPYVAVSLSKFNKPVFSTRTIEDTQSPLWEEEAFIPVSADAIETGEKLRLRLCDSDRFSADDALGVIEVDLADLADHSSDESENAPHRRVDELTADRPGMRATGSLEWSVRFCPLWHMAEEEMQERIKRKYTDRIGEPKPGDIALPWWMEWIQRYMDVPDFERDRKKRRQETLAWFTGEKEREEMEAAAKPSDDLRSGILQFHIHQCSDLEVESLQGTFSSSSNGGLSAASGKPALADVVDRTPAENPDPPSAYCEVLINDNLVYRTRTKQVTPLPYFNAVSERFLRDWRMARITFVVRDERNREHDPILGLITIRLRDALADRSQFTRWFPLVGGLGWGRIRISLLFKPIDIHLPPQLSGYDVATLEVKSLCATDLSKRSDRNISVILHTESDKFELTTPGEEDHGRSRVSLDLTSPGTPMSARSIEFDDSIEVEWEIHRPIRLAVQYRHSCSAVISFVTRSKVVKKKRVIGLATIRLDDCLDSVETERTVPIFATSEVKEAIKGGTIYWKYRNQAGEPETGTPITPTRGKSGGGPPIIGFVSVNFTLHPGVSRVHRRLCKRDLRFAKVYEAWETIKEIDSGWDKTSVGDMLRSTKDQVKTERHRRGDKQDGNEDDDGVGDESDTSEESSDEEGQTAADGVRRTGSHKSGKSTKSRKSGDEPMPGGLDDDDGIFSAKKAHSHALHKRHKGIFQLKIARTGRFVKDKLEAKMYASKDKERRHGQQPEVEREGQSAL